MRDTLHQAAVPGKNPGSVIDDVVTGTVECSRQHFLGKSETHRIRDSLAQRTGRGLDSKLGFTFRVTGRAIAELAEIPDFVDVERIAA